MSSCLRVCSPPRSPASPRPQCYNSPLHTAWDHAAGRFDRNSRLPMTLRKLLAGLVLGIGSALIVLGLDASGWLTPLESKTYDWRIRAAVSPPARGQPGHRPRRDQRHDASATSRPSSGDGRGRAWRWRRSSTSSIARPAKVIAIDVALSRAAARTSRSAIGERRSRLDGREVGRDARGRDPGEAGNVILLADAVYHGRRPAASRRTRRRPGAARRYKLGPAVEERPLVLPPFQIAHRRGGGARPQLPRARSRRAGAADAAVRPQRRQVPAVARRRRGADGGRVPPADVAIDGERAAHRRPRDAAAADQGRGRDRLRAACTISGRC